MWALVLRVAATGLWVYVAVFVGVWSLGQATLWFSELAVSPGLLNAVLAVVLFVVTAVVLLPAGLPRRLQRLLVLVCLARRPAGVAQAGDDPWRSLPAPTW